MNIRQSSVNIIFPRITDYRKKYIIAEEELKEHFVPATLLPIPDEVQESVPRIISQTKGGHSTLNIALNVASFTTVYNNDFLNDWNKCKQYLSERCSDVYAIVNRLTDKIHFIGMVLQLEFPDILEDGLELIKRSILGDNSKKVGDPDDFAVKLTYIYKDRYYINISLENQKRFTEIKNGSNQKYIIAEDQKNIVAVTIDINDRFAYNQKEEYQSNQEVLDDIINIASGLIENKLTDLILKGIYSNEQYE